MFDPWGETATLSKRVSVVKDPDQEWSDIIVNQVSKLQDDIKGKGGDISIPNEVVWQQLQFIGAQANQAAADGLATPEDALGVN